MKSLLTTTGKIQKKTFAGVSLRTNLELLMTSSDFREAMREDEILIRTVMDTMAEVEMHDLRVEKLSVVRQGKRIHVWAQAEGGLSFLGKEGKTTRRARTTLDHEACFACGSLFYSGKDFRAKDHQDGCDVVKVHEVMED